MKRAAILLALICVLALSGCSEEAVATLNGSTYLESMTAQTPETVEIYEAGTSEKITDADDIRQIMQLLSGLSVSRDTKENLTAPGGQSIRVVFVYPDGSEKSVGFPCFTVGERVYSIRGDDPALRELSGYIDWDRVEAENAARQAELEAAKITAARTIADIRPHEIMPGISREGRLTTQSGLYSAPVETGEPVYALSASTSVYIYCMGEVFYAGADKAELWCFVGKRYGSAAGWVRAENVQPGVPTSEAVVFTGPYELAGGAAYYDVDLMTGEKTARVFTGEAGSGVPVWNHGFDERVWLWHFVGEGGYEIWTDTPDAVQLCMESCILEPAEEGTAAPAAPAQADAGLPLPQYPVSEIETDAPLDDASLHYVGEILSSCPVYAAPVASTQPLRTLDAGDAVDIYCKARVDVSGEEQAWYLIGCGEGVGWAQEDGVQPGLTSDDRLRPGPYRMKDGAPYYFVSTAGVKTPQVFDAQTDQNPPLWNVGFDEHLQLWCLVGNAGWEVFVEDLSGIEDYPGEVPTAP